MSTETVPSKFLSYLRLFRLPNVFTAFADIAMGYCFVRGAEPPDGSLAGLLIASGAIYVAGMVLNDVYDVEVDRIERPRRPLPSGAIELGWARQLGYALLLIGIAAAWLAPWLASRLPAGSGLWRSGVVGSLLAGCVVLYDRLAKQTPLGPLVMGSCRLLNVLLGMSAAVDPHAAESALFWGYTAPQLAVAAGIGTYITGVTIFARGEAAMSHRVLLALGLLVMAGGFVLLAKFPDLGMTRRLAMSQPKWWPLLITVLAVFIVRPALRSLVNPRPAVVQAAVKHLIISLITLDAVLTFAAAGMGPSLIVLALLAPMLLLGRWVYST
ncbi:MAG: hypothetical protein FJ295_04915 [Planctomycetes bacterium]|nr:hypothetical protein [Planctomycetota bacterium]